MSEAKTLGNNIRILSGFPFPSTGFTSERNGHPLIRIRDLQQQDPETYFTGDYDRSFLIAKGDILVGMDGDFNAIKWQGPPSLLNQRVCKITTKDPTLLDQDFLYHSLHPQLNRIHNGTAQTTVKHLSTKDLYSIDTELPPLPEQKKIAEILSGIDTRITADSKKLGKLFFLLQAAIETEVQLGSRKTPSLPLSSLFAEKPSNGISPPETEDEESIAAPGIDCISKSGFEAKRLKKVRRPNDWQRYLIKEGDFFITRANTPALVGMCAVATGIQQEMIYPDLMIRLRFKKAIHATYLESVFKSSFYRQIIQNSAQGTSQSMAKLNSQIISNIKVAIPEDSEVTQFNNNIERILGSIRFQKSKIDRLQKLKSGLSRDLLSGRKRVSV